MAYRRPDGHQVGYDYDLEERLTRVTRADGHHWQLDWNARGKVSRCQAPDGRDIHFHYNAAGEIIRREHPDVWVQTLERDDGGRVTTQTSQGKDRAPVTRHYQYDNYGRRTHATCADRRLRWSWNSHGQVTEHHQDQHRIGYQYASGNRLETITLPDGTEVRYRYDKHGNWTSLHINGEPVIRRTLDSQGRETERQAGNNTQTQIHDRYGCLIKRRWQGQTPATRRYRWDAESRVEAVIDSQTGDTYYERDEQGQLIQENDISYRYDLGGNRIPEGGKIEHDRLIETNTEKREYDALGAEIRVIAKTAGLASSETRKFDAEGQLIEVRKPGLHVTYGYDALGRRAWRKSEAGTTTYLWHNDVVLGEQSPEGLWQWYIRDPKTDEPLLTLIDGQPHYYELDWRMMPIRLWDQAGDMVWQANSDAWGLCQPEMPNGPIHQPIRLPGQFEDELTGIVQNRFREYEPGTGSYLTADPLGLRGGLTSYRYTRNPVDFIDPRGLSFELVVTPEGVCTFPEMAGMGEGVSALSEVPEATGIIAPLEDNYFRDSLTGQVTNFLFGDLATNAADLWRSTFGDERYVGINPMTNENQGYTNRTERVFSILPIPAAKGATTVAQGVKRVPNKVLSFKQGEGLRHFEKHGQEIAETLGQKSYSLSQYFDDANAVVRNGQFSPELNAYVSIAGGEGGAKGLMVGLDRVTGEITTMHLKPISFFEKKAPSLGWQTQPRSMLTDLVGPKPNLGWKAPYPYPSN